MNAPEFILLPFVEEVKVVLKKIDQHNHFYGYHIAEQKAQGEPIKYNDRWFYICKWFDGWELIDAETGCSLCNAKTKSECLEIGKRLDFDEKFIDAVENGLDLMITNLGEQGFTLPINPIPGENVLNFTIE